MVRLFGKPCPVVDPGLGKNRSQEQKIRVGWVTDNIHVYIFYFWPKLFMKGDVKIKTARKGTNILFVNHNTMCMYKSMHNSNMT